jgi:hypothetical protein
LTCSFQLLSLRVGGLGAVTLGFGRLGEVGVQMGGDRVFAGDEFAAGDEDGH